MFSVSSTMSGKAVIGGIDNDGREGVVSLTLEGVESGDLVEHFRTQGIRVHIRKDDHYCGNILKPLGLKSCVLASISHYNTIEEVAKFLAALREISE